MSAEQQQTESAQVAVRIRPLNRHEKDANSQIIIRTQSGKKVFIKNPETGEEKDFTVDHAFESFDKKEVGGAPLAVPDQKQFFDTVVAPTLQKEFLEQGHNLLVMVYGETGTGHSYTVLGPGNGGEQQAGILPRACQQILDKVAEDEKNSNIKSSVSLQVVEVYCEQVNDLLTDRRKWPERGHKPKLTKDGYIVETAVKNIEKMADVEETFQNRSVSSNALYSASSRAHTIYTIRYDKRTRTSEDATQEEVVSTRINLVDFAGSERIKSAGTTGQMLKEGNAIGLSLTALGHCIHALSEGKRPGFRDSKLTLLLQDSMTNGKMIMIGTVSPASTNHDESLATLRFVDRTKSIKIQSKVNTGIAVSSSSSAPQAAVKKVDPVAAVKKVDPAAAAARNEMEEMRFKMQQEIDQLKGLPVEQQPKTKALQQQQAATSSNNNNDDDETDTDDDDESFVKVAVRVRVFNWREKEQNATRCVRMEQNKGFSKTWIKNAKGEEREFSLDCSFNTFSKDEEAELGPYADQNYVYKKLGESVLSSALEGRNVCLFSYGSAGSGKSYSMLGSTTNPEQEGIIPRVCRRLCQTVAESNKNPLCKASISLQVVEIYCEQVNDLLSDRRKWPNNGHKPKLTKDGYVVETAVKDCANYEQIEAAFQFSNMNRSVCSTPENPVSSRGHTIYIINYEKKTRDSEDATQEEVVSSRINLVDLASSERTESAGTTGQMLKEGNAINLSLTALGSCISALSEDKRPGFRDSKLTLLLQGSMMNGKIIVIGGISPASTCYDDSLATLRFMDQLKQVRPPRKESKKLAATDETVDPVAEITKEKEQLRQRMQKEIDELKKNNSK